MLLIVLIIILYRHAMLTVSANTLKTEGVNALEHCLKEANEAIITVRGREKYVVMSIETYEHLRAMELDAAIAESKRDQKEGKFHTDITAHIKKVSQCDDL